MEKRIPMCAGMGGGSSDAVTIRALNQLWLLTLSRKDMMDIGIPIGSDVPYCLLSGCAQVTVKVKWFVAFWGCYRLGWFWLNQILVSRLEQFF
ncbi:4-diphosphocytidyl-2-C-methyl-D-erythritol kinase [Streptococcus pyogenes]|nr:4-diphosphocytidyl-2-C-methyl-D-erythritol kinase [Streptococcus pyogenes]VHB99061.1 4-diphosphocytidyl-2-C-methyl-D-erythritol kinase [Streptococcus pyogenes]VHC37674.1 4-diphosphocytidyl-2-C-methyl-D-erythritol kinase [Streptococcus pyogenes]